MLLALIPALGGSWGSCAGSDSSLTEGINANPPSVREGLAGLEPWAGAEGGGT